MAKRQTGNKSIIAAVGGVLIGSAILLFVVTMVMNSLKSVPPPGNYHKFGSDGAPHVAYNASAMVVLADWNATNNTIAQLQMFMTICAILLGILGIVLIGSTIIGAIGGGFGG
ncbi:MAG TPA: hypothetical protein VMY59_08920 [Candidatus Thermoplasmatota archaeon]|nr:hypothetical protein [Candidatus Thermoplasmatota archaeon]